MIYSMTSDYFRGVGDPGLYLKRIAQSGFTHIHWCHQWNTDFIYTDVEIGYIESVMRDNSLNLLNLHASAGNEKSPASEREHERRAGVELVRNRLGMTARLGGEAIILHAPQEDSAAFRRSLDELERPFRDSGIRLALENTGPNFPALRGYLRDYAPEFLGLCYDCGHGNLPDFQPYLEEIKSYAERIYAFHLHDNDGASDQHKLPFSGTTDWRMVAALIAASPCRGNLNLESNMSNYKGMDEMDHLRQAMDASKRLAEMVGAYS